MSSPITNSSTPQPTEASSFQPAYISPVLKLLDPKSRPQPSPACETCPASLWFSPKDQLKCFCTRMHVLTWDTMAEEPPEPVMVCDGREIALMELAAQIEAAMNAA